MARAVVEVHSGICGFVTNITAVELGDGMVSIAIDSNCGNCRGLAGDLHEMDPMKLLVGKAKDNPIFAAAARHPLHQACPVPIGVAKAVEVAAGLALPRNVEIKVEKVD